METHVENGIDKKCKHALQINDKQDYREIQEIIRICDSSFEFNKYMCEKFKDNGKLIEMHTRKGISSR